mmetsp:Transcript_3572/g.5281  ORF Transcript_3572/g.5281 Transcript_3572/m.5281 type:complete len:203 (+) Transcript_3572:91-699(+)
MYSSFSYRNPRSPVLRNPRLSGPSPSTFPPKSSLVFSSFIQYPLALEELLTQISPTLPSGRTAPLSVSTMCSSTPDSSEGRPHPIREVLPFVPGPMAPESSSTYSHWAAWGSTTLTSLSTSRAWRSTCTRARPFEHTYTVCSARPYVGNTTSLLRPWLSNTARKRSTVRLSMGSAALIMCCTLLRSSTGCGRRDRNFLAASP